MSDYTLVSLTAEIPEDNRITEESIIERAREIEEGLSDEERAKRKRERECRTSLAKYYLERVQKSHILDTLAQMTVDKRDRAILIEERSDETLLTDYDRNTLLKHPLSKLDIDYSSLVALIPQNMKDASIMDIIKSVLPDNCRVYGAYPQGIGRYRITLHQGPLYNDPLCHVALLYHQSTKCYEICDAMSCILCLPCFMPCVAVHLFNSCVCCEHNNYYYSRRPDKDS